MRVLLAISVVLCHVGPSDGFRLIPADLAVQCFFVISGFYMSLVLGDKYSLIPRGVFTFYRNRYLRLAPGFWIATTGCIALAFISGRTYYGVDTDSYVQLLSDIHPLSTIWICFSDLFMIGQDTLIFLKLDDGALVWNSQINLVPGAAIYLLLIPPAWSLGVEIWFYILAPLFASRGWKVLAAIFALSLGARLYAADQGYYDEPWTDRFFPFELAWFIWGMILQRAYRIQAKKIPRLASKIIFGCILISLPIYPFIPVEADILRWIYLGLFSFCVPILFHFSRGILMDRMIGELSYPIYLCHTVVQQSLQTLGWSLGEWTVTVNLFCTLSAAGLIYFLVDRSVDKVRQKWATQG